MLSTLHAPFAPRLSFTPFAPFAPSHPFVHSTRCSRSHTNSVFTCAAMNGHDELKSVPRYFSQNLISIFKQLPANDLRRQKTSAKKRQYLRKYLTHDGLIDWSLKQALLAWERRNWNDLRKLVCDTNTKPRHWPEKIKEELVLLRETELRDSQPFATLCECE
jgi:hypothetical protein